MLPVNAEPPSIPIAFPCIVPKSAGQPSLGFGNAIVIDDRPPPPAANSCEELNPPILSASSTFPFASASTLIDPVKSVDTCCKGCHAPVRAAVTLKMLAIRTNAAAKTINSFFEMFTCIVC